MFKSKSGILILGAALLSLGACESIKTEAKYPTGLDRNQTGGDIYGKKESVFGKDGLKVLGGKDKKEEDNGIGVNSYLWRASLDTVSFMPLASADPFGGAILTDWYTDPATPNERMKLNVFILGKELKTQNLRVRAFRQVKKSGSWVDAEVAENTARKLEDAILTRAREMRISKLGE
ncbi:MAG: DUF3576 domain-containing protein [Alphaproteobacteria bacterium]|nr:DUF3576 domain-containing protein [Alphaproteobacteria bacterium]